MSGEPSGRAGSHKRPAQAGSGGNPQAAWLEALEAKYWVDLDLEIRLAEKSRGGKGMREVFSTGVDNGMEPE
jgi:hypothetical protein